MRTLVLVVALVAPLVMVPPPAAAFDWCVEGVKDCRSHVVCVGRSTSGQREWCQVGIGPFCPECRILALP